MTRAQLSASEKGRSDLRSLAVDFEAAKIGALNEEAFLVGRHLAFPDGVEGNRQGVVSILMRCGVQSRLVTTVVCAGARVRAAVSCRAGVCRAVTDGLRQRRR